MGRQYVLVLGALALVVGLIVFFQSRDRDGDRPDETLTPVEEQTAEIVRTEPEPDPRVRPEPSEIVPPPPLVTEPAERFEPPPEPLPALDESDAPMTEGLTGIVGPEWVHQSLVANDLIRKIVVTVDNLPREKAALQLRPVKPVTGRFRVDGPEKARVISAENAARYTAFARLVAATDAASIAALYQRYYPLFQEAYRELGYPDQSFDTRVIEVIDHLLAAPTPAAPIRVERPHVLYTYSDEDLEAASAGHKVLMRMGRENADMIKDKLREVRAALAQ